MAGFVDAFLGAVLPVQCVGCLAWDVVMCGSCASLATVEPVSTSLEGRRGSIPLWVLGDYSGPLRRIVLGAKHAMRTDVSAFLDEAGATLGASLWRVVAGPGSPAAAMREGSGRAREVGGAVDVWVVPAPSSWGRRLRGRQVALPLARGVARGLAKACSDRLLSGGSSRGCLSRDDRRVRERFRVRVVDVLRLRVGVGSQSGKTGAARVVGRMGSMRARVSVPEGAIVIAVDDVVTTGATIREMERVLGRVDGVAALCRPGLIA
ncbi:ComF family protein [Actinomyces bouchesdurhonensis]|uniref:ComF family protein n=1 Tax=Actinomyces bouchesdurhonensis TaxID=1852361 RepID=UPI003C718141